MNFKQNENIKINFNVELPKNSLLNLVISASSRNLQDCKELHKDENHKHNDENTNLKEEEDKSDSLEEPFEPTEAPSIMDLGNENTNLSTKSIAYIRRLIDFCGLQGDEKNNTTKDMFSLEKLNTTQNSQLFYYFNLAMNTTKQVTSETSTSEKSSTSKTTTPIQQTTTPTTEETSTTQNELTKRVCPENFRDLEGLCIQVSTEKTNWIEAKSKCENLKSRLLIPNSVATYEKIILTLAEEIQQEFWVKLFFLRKHFENIF